MSTVPQHTDHVACAAAVRSRDPRFDGCFVTGVLTTRIYCRPSCPAMTPRSDHMRFFPTAAAAQGAGFRACKRCRPDATPGSPQWHVRGDLVARAVRLVDDGVVEREGVPGLASRLGYSTRQLQRLTLAELGAAPLALARARRAQTARILVETTDLPMADVAFAAGFASIRSFNDTVRTVFATTPRQLREQAGRTGDSAGPARARHTPGAPGSSVSPVPVNLRLPLRTPFHAPSLFGHLVATAVPGVEEWGDGRLHLALRLPHGPATGHLSPPTDQRHLAATLRLTDLRDLTAAIGRCRSLLDLDADPVAVDADLSADPGLAPLVTQAPGVRIPGGTDPHALALRVVLGQQVSTAAARTHAARLTRVLGEPLPGPLRHHGLTHQFPTAHAVAEAPEDALPALPASRRRTLRSLAVALAEGTVRLDPGADRADARAALLELPGVGPWTTEMILLRALGDPDAWPGSDLGVRSAATAAGLPGDVRTLEWRASGWRPWRGYAAALLWASSDHAAAGTGLRLDHPERPLLRERP
ncbi:AlkA N-terminal domain-containing protein [Ornithinimicrobium sp. LYQ103]|uniref:AlkA N-terminal domain-containing protein n=1 Tax=Ornithinimicrobium sp. LYQ103 TaxID=3378796 RepID=UPI003854B83A